MASMLRFEANAATGILLNQSLLTPENYGTDAVAHKVKMGFKKKTGAGGAK